jgi:hypothetical protein
MKTVSHGLALASLLTIGACGVVSKRSYLAEMEHDDESFFMPRKDFPVVPGDEGKDWRDEEVIRQRTPASLTDSVEEKQRTSLQRQLARLENSQSEPAFAHYQEHRARLASTSERIYFLQLPKRQERDEYLASRGLTSPHQTTFNDFGFGVPQEQLLLQMTKDEVVSSWGKPDRVDIAGKPAYENERWVYQRDGAVKYVYFEGGRVGGWTSNSQAATRGQNPFR